jgi:hypothetical protein
MGRRAVNALKTETPTFLLNLLFRRTAMTTLMIKDLSLTEELDSKAMAAVHGGHGWFGPSFDFSKVRTSGDFAAQQSNEQYKSVVLSVGNGNTNALVDKVANPISIYVGGDQSASNQISFR